MSTISVFDMTGKAVSETELSDAVFGIEPNQYVMHQMVLITSLISVRVLSLLLPVQK